MSSAEPKTRIDFMGKRYLTLFLSFIILSFCIFQWISSGSNKYGIDFLGGNEIVVSFEESLDISKIRSVLKQDNFNSASVQSFENQSFSKDTNEFSIRIKGSKESDAGVLIKKSLDNLGLKYEILRNDYVGPVVGEKIKNDGITAIFFAVIILLVYITWKFEFSFAVGAIFALLHDVFMAAGLFIFLGGEIGASALAAFLTILGYSVNDTIIVFDRIRENMFLKLRGKVDSKIGNISLKNLNMHELINVSINQTLSRTLLTSGTTLFTCFSLWYFGGGAISDLALILIIGIVTGTYSSIFVASPIILLMDKSKNK